MKFKETPISGVWVVEREAFEDNRGAFSRLFCATELQPVLGTRQIAQINHSRTSRVGAIRGLHFQHPPHAEMKIVHCIKGKVFDVAVDLRKESATFLQWTSVELTPQNRNALIIPEGCAHGFQVIEGQSELLYLHTAFYAPEAEGAVKFDEPKLNISWPLNPTDLSERDLHHPPISRDFEGITL